MTAPAKSEQDRVVIFDTTLRDGEQCPGATMTHEEKLEVAELLDQMGVDIIEAGFPIASEGDFAAVHEIAKRTNNAVVCGLSRAAFKDIDRCAEAIKPAKRSRIHTFISTSPVHMKYKLQKEPQEVYELVIAQVTRARNYTDDVEWSCEDGTRTEHDFLCRCVEAAINAGATTINIPDTVGYTVPEEYFALIEMVRDRVPNADKARFSAHCHDDLGMAVANSLTAVVAGARQIECTVNGIGERAGNCSLEEVVMALKTRDAFFNLDTGINTTRLYPTSRMLSNIVGHPIPRNKAVVGENAFAHESGIHQHGMLKHHSTYEIMRPQDVGLSRSALVLGKHSGRHALRERIKELGFELDEVEFARVFEEFKALADKKKELYDGDIEALVLQAEHSAVGPWSLSNLRTSSDGPSSEKNGAEATVRLRNSDGREIEMRATGDGPVDAALKAIERATGVQVVLRKFEVRSVSAGEDAQGEALVYVEYNARTYRGSSVSTNIVESATQAFLEVINRIELAQANLQRAREDRTGAARVAQAAV